jgi:kynurenine 3-monooxygenase
MTEKIIIVGAGSAGLLLAHYLLQRQAKYHIEIYDRRPDPRSISPENARSFPLTLNIRGINALNQIPGLEQAVKNASVMINGSIFHQNQGKNRVANRKTPLFCLDRTALNVTLLETLAQHPNFSQISLFFDTKCTEVDAVNKIAKFTQNDSNILTKDYDILIGADGARSLIRNQFLNADQVQEKLVYADYKTLFLPVDSRLQTNYIHGWRSPDTSSIILVAGEQFTSGVITFPRQTNHLVNLKTAKEVKQFFATNFPIIAEILPDTEAEAFAQRPLGTVLTIKCDRYHDQNHSILLIGDGAHAVSPSLGLGCNSAMEDVFILNNLLDQYNDNWTEVLPQFTEVRKADAHALVELSESPFPFDKKVFFELIIRQFWGKIIKKPSMFELLSNTNTPYAEIFNQYESWIIKVKKSNEKWLKKQNLL